MMRVENFIGYSVVAGFSDSANTNDDDRFCEREETNIAAQLKNSIFQFIFFYSRVYNLLKIPLLTLTVSRLGICLLWMFCI